VDVTSHGSRNEFIGPRVVPDEILWDHPPEFPRRANDDPLVKALLSRLSRAEVERGVLNGSFIGEMGRENFQK
jgi:hypothetical protein